VVNGAEAGAGVNLTLATASKGNAVNAAFTVLAQLTVWIAADSVRRRRAYSASLRERSLREALSSSVCRSRGTARHRVARDERGRGTGRGGQSPDRRPSG